MRLVYRFVVILIALTGSVSFGFDIIPKSGRIYIKYAQHEENGVTLIKLLKCDVDNPSENNCEPRPIGGKAYTPSQIKWAIDSINENYGIHHPVVTTSAISFLYGALGCVGGTFIGGATTFGVGALPGCYIGGATLAGLAGRRAVLDREMRQKAMAGLSPRLIVYDGDIQDIIELWEYELPK